MSREKMSFLDENLSRRVFIAMVFLGLVNISFWLKHTYYK